MTKQHFDFYWVDAFADRPFTGNPAGVVPLESWPDDTLLQNIAFENGLAETAFFAPNAAGHHDLRWFTPAAEVDLCGHATLATAHVMFEHLGYTANQVTFSSRSGPLHVQRRGDGKLELDFPARPGRALPPPDAIVRGLGYAPAEFFQAEANLAVFTTEEELRQLSPDFTALAELEQYGTIATAPGSDCDFVSRFFAPRVGVPEDPVTGSAHCVLVPYWAARLGKNHLHARQLSPRGGELWCELAGDRVKIAGYATLYLKGTLHC
jgi:predicted PhzF superfamily epimerase YddE/YHI9